MVTTVGTEDKLDSLLTDLVQLDHDAVLAYDAAIERLGTASHRSTLAGFRRDHLRHIEELDAALLAMGKVPPKDSDMKALLTQGKVVLAGLVGDKAILRAMKANEDDTNIAYERAVQHRHASPELRHTLEAGLADERRHRAWLIETIERLG